MAAAIPTLRLHTFAMAIVCGPRVWGTRLPHEGCARQQSQLGSSTNRHLCYPLFLCLLVCDLALAKGPAVQNQSNISTDGTAWWSSDAPSAQCFKKGSTTDLDAGLISVSVYTGKWLQDLQVSCENCQESRNSCDSGVEANSLILVWSLMCVLFWQTVPIADSHLAKGSWSNVDAHCGCNWRTQRLHLRCWFRPVLIVTFPERASSQQTWWEESETVAFSRWLIVSDWIVAKATCICRSQFTRSTSNGWNRSTFA